MLFSTQERIRVQKGKRIAKKLVCRAIWRVGELKVLIFALFTILATFRSFYENMQKSINLVNLTLFAPQSANPPYAQAFYRVWMEIDGIMPFSEKVAF